MRTGPRRFGLNINDCAPRSAHDSVCDSHGHSCQRPSDCEAGADLSVVRGSTPGAVPTQDLQAIQVPVLVYHHARDGCKHCQASDTPAILRRLARAPVKKLMVFHGGANPHR